MEQTYTKEQLIQSGKDLVNFLIEITNSANSINGFLKEYIALLTAENGIYKKQQDAMRRIAESSEGTQKEADKMMRTSEENGEALQSMCNEFQSLNDTITTAQKGRATMDAKVRNLNDKIKDISSSIKNIQEVSQLTNLLSFNASIEAARAGTAGKGFRIIANEVKKLSGRTQSITSEIETKVKELEKEGQDVVNENHAHDAFMDSLQKTAVESNERLTQIKNDNHENNLFMKTILKQMSENQSNIITVTNETESKNIEQVQYIASHAAENSIQTDDQLSFLFELKHLFEWFETHRELFAY